METPRCATDEQLGLIGEQRKAFKAPFLLHCGCTSACRNKSCFLFDKYFERNKVIISSSIYKSV